ncbi:shikimate dehydrogenase [Corynebacterium epidermidicanis]|uniref:shikimate dehydrogenase (NADP(+)) n=1 Tax=Corynebacterium epidermidicanis TaxID=1050174 RepID=A0A0G3GPX5_9CORY|nr:shikimate dehydrogenase [Corynebacterium epidermidicanis]AKK03251.1 shikimate 5-dehydrogenase [Corynebacterium epidermidicanis]
MTQLAAVLGSPISHSLSPVLHNAGYAALGLDWRYHAIECTAEELPGLVAKHADHAGFSVTMPGKFAALAFADRATDRARAIGSANTLVRLDDGWLADNTDGLGVLGALAELGGEFREVTLLGAGGTARAVVWALSQLGVSKINVHNRTDRAAELAEVADVEITWQPLDAGDLDGDLIINTVPSRSLPDLIPHAPVFDVIYDPWPTELVRRAPQAVGGHIMLAHQAFAQFELFTGKRAPQAEMFAALEEALRIH